MNWHRQVTKEKYRLLSDLIRLGQKTFLKRVIDFSIVNIGMILVDSFSFVLVHLPWKI